MISDSYSFPGNPRSYLSRRYFLTQLLQTSARSHQPVRRSETPGGAIRSENSRRDQMRLLGVEGDPLPPPFFPPACKIPDAKSTQVAVPEIPTRGRSLAAGPGGFGARRGAVEIPCQDRFGSAVGLRFNTDDKNSTSCFSCSSCYVPGTACSAPNAFYLYFRGFGWLVKTHVAQTLPPEPLLLAHFSGIYIHTAVEPSSPPIRELSSCKSASRLVERQFHILPALPTPSNPPIHFLSLRF